MVLTDPHRVLNVGIIGCGEVAQTVHIPTLSLMRQWFRITYLCDISLATLKHCTATLHDTADATLDPKELCASETVDVVLVVNSDEYHAAHAILALEHDKHVLVEKPLALTKRDIRAIIEAERMSKGKVMVGYMRRYAAPFDDAIQEIRGMDKVLYARVRAIIGPNSTFVAQSGTFPQKFADFDPIDSADLTASATEMVRTALVEECDKLAVTPESTDMWRWLAGLGSHDLSVMREALGMPEKVVGSSLQLPFWNVLFKYPGFTVSYESGFDDIPRFDAHIEVYSAAKSVRIQYDTPYVKGLPVTVHVAQNLHGAYVESTVRRSFEDPYTLELKKLWELIVMDVPVKTTAEDALQDLELFSMIMNHGFGAAPV